MNKDIKTLANGDFAVVPKKQNPPQAKEGEVVSRERSSAPQKKDDDWDYTRVSRR